MLGCGVQMSQVVTPDQFQDDDDDKKVSQVVQKINESISPNWFSVLQALGLRRDDTFSKAMLDYSLEWLMSEVTPCPGLSM